jgi:hypothetical protein
MTSSNKFPFYEAKAYSAVSIPTARNDKDEKGARGEVIFILPKVTLSQFSGNADPKNRLDRLSAEWVSGGWCQLIRLCICDYTFKGTLKARSFLSSPNEKVGIWA